MSKRGSRRKPASERQPEAVPQPVRPGARRGDPPPYFVTEEVDRAYEEGRTQDWLDLLTPHVRHICSRLKLFQGCPLARCRRARTCTGHRRETTFHASFPPCVANNDLHAMWLKEQKVYINEVFAYDGVPKEEWL
jgi:hypothetical protein